MSKSDTGSLTNVDTADFCQGVHGVIFVHIVVVRRGPDAVSSRDVTLTVTPTGQPPHDDGDGSEVPIVST